MSNISETNVKRDLNHKEIKNAYMREYMKKYRKNNTEFYEREKKYVGEYIKNRYNNDPEYHNKKNEYCLRYYHKKRQEMLANAISV